MSKFVTRTLAGGAVALGMTLLSSSAFAVTALGHLDPDDAGSFSENVSTGAIDVEATFTLTMSAITALSATISTRSSARVHSR